ncbi:MAG: tetraacyldisaccharide 4'-kinase [Syntrophobacterales bacterium]|nr:tetraacyldisaccharide 4'-kinase [Syntrophobacterales bacterium]
MTIPNILTFFRILLTPIFLILLLNHRFTEALIIFFIAGLTDGLDGFIARAFKQKSLLGAFLDPIADKTLLVSAFVALTWLNMMPLWLTAIVITRDLAIITGASLLVIAEIPFEIRPSIAGKTTTLFQLATVITTLASKVFQINNTALWALFLLSTIMTFISGWDYTRKWNLLWKSNNGWPRLIHRLTIKLLPVWYGKHKIPKGLEMLSFLYLAALHIHRTIFSANKVCARSLVISVGNITVGGTGKTPFTIQLAKTLFEHGFRVAVVTRALGRIPLKTPKKVSLLKPDVREYGDEPILISTHTPHISVWVGSSKSKTVKFVDRTERPDVIIVDDAYQHWPLERNLDIVILDAEMCIGNGSPLPIGPLREHPLALRRADFLVLNTHRESSSDQCNRRIRKYLRSDAKILHCERHIEEIFLLEKAFPIELFRRFRCFAFAGIAFPGRFFHDLETHGITLVHRIAFSDHHIYTNDDIQAIVRDARSRSAQIIITTEKDFVRLPEEAKSFIAYAKLSFVNKDVFATIVAKVKHLWELKSQRGGKDVPYHFER